MQIAVEDEVHLCITCPTLGNGLHYTKCVYAMDRNSSNLYMPQTKTTKWLSTYLWPEINC